MNRPNYKRHQHLKRAIATALAVVYLGSTEGPMFLAIAAPQVFVRPGAGVSRLPLEVAAFGAPGFGDVQDAINLASGNVFVDAGGASRNNLLGAGGSNDETQNTIGGGNWNLTPRLRLGGFSKTWGNAVGVTANASATTLAPGGISSLTATLSSSTGTTVSWSIVSPTTNGGTLSTIAAVPASTVVTYTAPTSVAGTTSVVLQAKSFENALGTVTITVNPTTTISSAQALAQTTASSTGLALSASVSGPTNTNVNWSLVGTSAGALSASSAASGASVTYRPPCVIAGAAAQTAQVKATSAADANKSLTFTVTINAEVAGSRVTCGSDLASSKWARTTGLGVNRFFVPDTTAEDSDGALDQFTVTNATSNNFLEHSPVTIADGERVTVSFVASGSGSINYTVRPDSCAPATENCEPYDLNNSGARGTAATPDYGDYSYITLTGTPTKYSTTFTKSSDTKPAKLVIGGINPGAVVNLGGAKIVPATTTVAVTNVSLVSSNTQLGAEGSITLTPTVTGTGAFNAALNWTVSPTTAGTFSSANPVTGAVAFYASSTLASGTSVTITATSVQTPAKTASVALTSHAKVLGSQSALTSNPPWVRQNVLGFTANALAVSTLLDKDGFLDNFTTTSYGYLQTPLTVPSGQTVRVSFVGQSTNSATVNFDLRNGTSGAVLTGTDALSATRNVTLSSTATRSVNMCYANTTGIPVDLIIAGIDSTTEVIRLGGVRAELVTSCTVGGSVNAVQPVIQASVQPNKAKTGISSITSNWISRLGAQATLVNGGVQQPWFSNHKQTSTSSQKLNQPDSKIERASKTPSTRGREVSLVNATSLGTLPTTVILYQGDGSGVTFTKKAMATTDWTAAPSWIKRYQPSTDLANTVFYTLQTQPGVQYSAGWIVVRVRDGNTTLAHYYEQNGTRHTFFTDGEYEDYTQDVYQQYRGVKYNADPEGQGTACANNAGPATPTACTPKTEIVYTAPGSGRILKVRDEWGRVTVYTWNTPSSGALSDGTDGTLNSIYYLVTDENSAGTTYARRATFEYTTYGAIRAVTAVTYAGPDGKGAEISRRFEFQYATQPTSGKLVMTKIRRPVLGGGTLYKDTTYTYDAQDRVITVATLGEPDLNYGFNSLGGGASTLGGTTSRGPWVTVTQGSGNEQKVAESYFDGQNQLIEKRVKDYNPNAAVTRTLVWKYDYYAAGTTTAGSTKTVVSPSGRKDVYSYHFTGQVSRIDTYLTEASATPVRSKVLDYDGDARIILSRRPAVSGNPDNVSYAYNDLDTITEYTLRPNEVVAAGTSANQSFTAPKLVSRILKDGTTEKYRDEDTIDAYGRRTQSARRIGAGMPLRATNYTFHSGENWTVYRPNAEGKFSGVTTLAKQFADQVYTSDDGRGLRTFNYDIFGNTNWELRASNFSGLANDNTTQQTRDTSYFHSYNGFGQMVWEAEYDRQAGQELETRYTSRKIWNYYATGELDSSWDGEPANTTDYRYAEAANIANFGRVMVVVKGIGDGNAITTQHESVAYCYDAFGRKSCETLDNLAESNRTFIYDTLDRLVITYRNGLPEHGIGYDVSGTPNVDANYNGGTSIYNITNMTVDALGRVISSKIKGVHPTSPTTEQTITTTYDPYDRPIKVVDGRLTMNTAGDDQASFTKYDAMGHVLFQTGPVMRSGTDGVLDPRRTDVYNVYDNYGRKTLQQVELTGTVTTPGTFPSFPDATHVANTQYEYDAYDRPITLTDPDGSATFTAYDNAGNPIQRVQTVCSSADTTCKAGSTGLSSFTINGVSRDNAISTSSAYDALGRSVKVTDARGNASRVAYNSLGLKVAESDARGITTKVYRYTGDGLLDRVLEPDFDPGTPATAISLADQTSNPAGYGVTKRYDYGSRKYPTSAYSAAMTVDAYSTNPTEYLYDWAGRPTTTKLPSTDGGTSRATITQSYDARGNQTSIKDADGFVTNSSYDAFDRLISQKNPPRTGNTADSDAFPLVPLGWTTDGFKSTYSYDEVGNLTSKTERLSRTDYSYNSLGKAVRETRAYSASCGTGDTSCPGYKYRAYRLDGEKVGETTYDYKGDFTSQVANTTFGTNSMPTVTAGAATVYDLSSGGKRVAEQTNVDKAYQTLTTSPAINNIQYVNNGLGLRVKRAFDGVLAVYSERRNAIGTARSSAAYDTYYTYDANGNLTRQSETPPSDPPNGANEVNIFTYAYSATNKEVQRSSDAKVYVSTSPTSSRNVLLAKTSTASATTGSAGGSSTGYVTPLSITSFTQNERDLLDKVASSDVDFRDGNGFTTDQATSGRTTTYQYFLDGAKSRVDVSCESLIVCAAGAITGTSPFQTFSYDARGRLKASVDNNGDGQGSGAVTTNYSYGADGSVTRSLSNGSFTQTTSPTIGGLTAKTVTDHAAKSIVTSDGLCPVASASVTHCVLTTTNTFSATRGLQSTSNTTVTGTSTTTPGKSLSYSYDAFGNRTQVVTTQGNPSKTETTTITFNGNNDQTGDSTPSTDINGNAITLSHAFTLDSSGHRIGVAFPYQATDPSQNYAQRYDADENAVSLIGRKHNDIRHWPVFEETPETDITRDLEFRFDPRGNLIMSVNANLVAWTGTDNNGLVNKYQLAVKSQSSVVVDGQVQFMHSLNWRTGYQTYGNSVAYWWTPFDTSTTNLNTKNRDETYGLADSLAEDGDKTWDVFETLTSVGLAVFNVPKVPTSVLSAPTKPLSATVRVDPLTVTAPGVKTPSVGDPLKVAPPTEQPAKSTSSNTSGDTPSDTDFSSATTLAQDTSIDAEPSKAASSPSVGVSAFSVAGPNASKTSSTPPATTISGTPSNTQNATSVTTPSNMPFSSQNTLQAPSSVLPKAISSVTPSSVTAPQSITIPKMDPTKVTPPSSSVPPATTTPKVTPPSTTVPKVGPVGSVTPPNTDSTDTVITTQGINKVYCGSSSSCSGYTPQYPTTVTSASAVQSDFQTRATGLSSDGFYDAKMSARAGLESVIGSGGADLLDACASYIRAVAHGDRVFERNVYRGVAEAAKYLPLIDPDYLEASGWFDISSHISGGYGGGTWNPVPTPRTPQRPPARAPGRPQAPAQEPQPKQPIEAPGGEPGSPIEAPGLGPKEIPIVAPGPAGIAVVLLIIASLFTGDSKKYYQPTAPYDDDFFEHLIGHINPKGKPVGYHINPNGQPPITSRIVPDSDTPKDSNNVYKASVEIFDPKTGTWKFKEQSTFFPDEWDLETVFKEIDSAWDNKLQVIQPTGPKANSTVFGCSSSGIVIKFFVKPDGKIDSAFPAQNYSGPGGCP